MGRPAHQRFKVGDKVAEKVHRPGSVGPDVGKGGRIVTVEKSTLRVQFDGEREPRRVMAAEVWPVDQTPAEAVEVPVGVVATYVRRAPLATDGDGKYRGARSTYEAAMLPGTAPAVLTSQAVRELVAAEAETTVSADLAAWLDMGKGMREHAEKRRNAIAEEMVELKERFKALQAEAASLDEALAALARIMGGAK